MARRPTGAQDEAIRKDHRDLCVTAGAGSGKTRVLVERFVRLVLKKDVPVDRILAITFTEKAAAEMKGRIADALERAGREDLRRQVEFSYLSTIDAFCARILRENALEAEVDPRFAVLEELESDRLLGEAADEVLLAREEGEMFSLLEATGINDLAEVLESLYRQVRASGKPPEPATLEPPEGPGEGPGTAFPREIRRAVDRVIHALRSERLTPLQTEKGKALLDLPAEVEAISASASAPEIAAAFQRFQGRIKLTGVRNEVFKTALTEVREALEDGLAARLEEKVRPLRRLLGELLAALGTAYETKKREAGSLDFSDLEWKVRGLLKGSPAVRRKLAGKFDHLFVDEFQDTNPLQKEILDLLHAGNSFFAAGDAKQSIYGFRDADVEILEGFRKQVEPVGGHVALPDNFRSRPEIVSFSNRLFASSLWKSGGVGFEAMVASADHAAKGIPSVEILAAEGARAEDGREAEAEALAARIASLVEGGEIRFSRRESHRLGTPLRYGDVAILLRSTTSMRVFERALAGRQVPYFVQKGRGYFQTQEVRDMTNLIRALDNPRDDYCLAAVLRSPLCGLTDDDLYRLCRRNATGAGRLADRVRLEDKDLSETGRDRLRALLETLDGLRARKGRGPLWTDLDSLLSVSPLASEALFHFNGRRRFANLRKLVDLVRAWEEGGKTSLPDLVEMLETYSGPEVRESEAAVESAEEDSVKLMTIHAAKGLEFPMVAVADLGRSEPPRRHGEIFRRDLGLGIPLYDPEEGNRGLHPASYLALRRWKEASERQEENRLLYVAVTRAREHLLLSGWWKEGKAQARSWLAAILEGLGGEAALRDDPGVRWLEQPAREQAATGSVSILEAQGDRIRGLLPLPPTPAIRAAEASADEILRRAALPSPPVETTPYLVTATEIVQHHLCPRRYHLRYRIGAPALEYSRRVDGETEGEAADVKDDELPAEVLGDRVHRILAEDPGSPVVEAILSALPEGDREAARRQVETFRQSALGRQAAAGEALREVPFVMARKGAMLRGQIDLILRDGEGRLLVVDYKTSRIDLSGVEEKSADYELQLRIYALAVKEIFGKRPDGAFLHFLHPDVLREVGLSDPSLEEAERAIDAFFEAHRTGDYPRHVGERCRSCGYREVYCPNVIPGEAAGPPG